MIAPARNTNGRAETISSWFAGLRNDYEAAKPSRFVRTRRRYSQMGSGSDYHYRSMTDYLKLVEIARDIDRNDPIVGQAVNRVVANVCQDGFKLDPATGDKRLDADLKSRWTEWSESEQSCCSQGEFAFDEMAELALRAAIVDGDIGGNPLASGELETVEAHRIRSSTWNKKDNVIHGVELGPTRRRAKYWVTKQDVDPMSSITLADLMPIDAYRKGRRNFFHLYMPKRFSQTRGITSLAPISATVSQHDDIQFAKLVQQQIVSCWAILRERAASIPNPKKGRAAQGAQETVTDASGWGYLQEKMFPGMEVMGKPGEKLRGFSPNVPNMEYFDHVRLTLTYIAINLDLPLIVLLLDASETNFSGWRGAWDQAKMRLRTLQRQLGRKWHRPVYLWKLQQWLAEDARLRAAMERRGLAFFKHRWNYPGWPYIEPLKDATADLIQQRNALNSPRRIQAARGRDWEELTTEIVDDNDMLLVKAATKWRKFIKKFPELDGVVDFREFMSLPTPDKVSSQLALSMATGTEPTEVQPKRDRQAPSQPVQPQPMEQVS